MPKTLVWQPDADRERSKPKQSEEKKKQTKAKKKFKQMSDVFWDSHIKSGEPVIFHFLNGSKLPAKVLERDIYHLNVSVDDKIRMIFKHALKWAEEIKSEDATVAD